MTHSFLKISLASTMAVVLATPAWAQDSGSDNSGEIIVTARRTEEKLQDVPISMTVLNSDDISKRNLVSTADLGAYVPSLTVNNQFGPEKASFVLRGFTQAYHTAPTVGVYFADVIAPRALGPTTSGNGAGIGSMFDLENIQVLKGPQGTLFGRNTTGGAILLVPAKPKDRLEGYVEASVGSYNMHRIQAVLNVPITDTFKVRAGVDWNKADGYVKNHSGIGPADFDNTNYVAARFSAVWNVTPDIENYTIGSYSRSNTHGDVPKLATCSWPNGPFASPSNPNGWTGLGSLLGAAACTQVARQNARGDGIWDVENNNPFAQELIEQWSVINTTTWKASDNLTIKNIASYSEYKEKADFSLWGDNYSTYTGFPYSGTGFFPDYFGLKLNGPVGTPLKTINLHGGRYPYTTAQNSFTEELQFQGHSSDNRLTWQAGAYIEVSHPLDWNSQDVEIFTNCVTVANPSSCNPLYIPVQFPPNSGTFVPFPVGSISDANTKDWFNDKALFAQATYKFNDQFSITGGFRYTWDQMTDLAESLNIDRLGSYCQDVVVFNTAPAGTQVNAGNVAQYALYTTDPSKCDISRTIKSHRPTWEIDLQYRPNPDLMLYAKYARGYRMGSLTSNSIGFETVGPEKLDMFEIGAKKSFRGAISGYFNIAGFYNDFHDQQITINPAVNPLYQGVIPNAAPNINAGHSRIWGIEVDTSLKLFQGFKLDFGYTYLDTKVLQITLPTNPIFYDPSKPCTTQIYCSLNATASVGSPLPLSPKNTLTLSGTYTLPLSDDVGKISIGATFLHADANQAQDPDTSPMYLISEMNQVNFNVDWRQMFGNPVDLSFYMTNATNQGRIVYPSSAFETIGGDGGHVNQPRMWGFRLKYHFGRE